MLARSQLGSRLDGVEAGTKNSQRLVSLSLLKSLQLPPQTLANLLD